MSETAPVKTIDQRFRVIAPLGSGGFGAVFKTEDAQLSRMVAVKVLNVETAPDAARFDREAKALSRLQHKHIVTILSYGREESGRPYIAMQYLQGKTLGELIHAEGKLDWQRVARIGVQAAAALNAAHGQGIIHRDLKPENIMLLDDPEPDFVKLLDFGLSSFLFDSPDSLQKLTQTGSIVGTAHYLSPESSLGQKADARSDVYSLACVLYQAVTGVTPSTASDPVHVLYDHINRLPQRFDKHLAIPEAFEHIIFKALQKNPDDRFQTMAEFEQALNAVLADPVSTPTLGSLKLPDSSNSQPGTNGALKLGAIALLLGALALAVPYMVQPPAPRLSEANTWQMEQDFGRVELQREQPEAAWNHFCKAVQLASNNKEKFQSELSLGELVMSNTGNDRSQSLVEIMQDASKIAGDKIERAEAQTCLGLAYYEGKQYRQATESLKDTPWSVYEHAGDGYWRRQYSMIAAQCKLRLGLAYSELPDSADKARAIRWLEEGIADETEQTDARIKNQVTLAKLYLQSDDPRLKQKGATLLRQTSAQGESKAR